LLLISGQVWAQSELRKANEHFRSYEFARAITEYQQVLQNRPANLAQNLAHAYRLNNNSREAEIWFAKVLTFPGHEPINIYYYAEALKSNGKYAQARDQYQAYAAKVPAEAALVAKRVQAVDLAQTWLSQPAPVALQPVAALNSGYADFSPAFFDDGLLFVSDRPAGAGRGEPTGWTGRPYTQLFYAKKESGGAWTAPAPLEPAINTRGRESFPVIAADGTLYFASDGHPGMGGLDLFSARGEQASWREVVNLKPPFNSPQNDFGILREADGRTGYLSSNRESAVGTDNIYAFKPVGASPSPAALAKPDTLVNVAASAKPTPLSPNLVLSIRTRQQGPGQQRPLAAVALEIATQPANGAAVQASSGTSGMYWHQATRGTAYTISAAKPGYLNQAVSVATAGFTGDTLPVDLLVHRAQAEVPIILNNIYYDLDKADIRPDAAIELNKLVALLQANPKIKIEISAHTDSRESQEYNLKLSQRRAKAVVKYLTDNGIDPGRLTAKDYGKSRLLYHCPDSKPCSEAQQQLNRRTEFKIRQ
jgi:outer membrane protein OmpA-like peptidoglycan-associated protein